MWVLLRRILLFFGVQDVGWWQVTPPWCLLDDKENNIKQRLWKVNGCSLLKMEVLDKQPQKISNLASPHLEDYAITGSLAILHKKAR